MTSIHRHAADDVESRPEFDRVVLVHGFNATIDDHWFPWLATQIPRLERVDLPTPSAPVAMEWIRQVREAIGRPTPGTAVVTHSLGGITALRALGDVATLDDRLGALVLVAPFAQMLPPTGLADVDAFVGGGLSAFLDGFDPARVRATVDSVAVVRSDDDPLVPVRLSDAVAEDVGAEVRVIPGAGHFMADEGVTRVEPILPLLSGAVRGAPR